MLRPEDERAIDDLFERLRNAEQNSGPRDVEAEALIREKLRQNPAAAYYLAQTVIVQEAALREQQKQIEAQRRDDRGFLGGIFGDDRPRSATPSQPLPPTQESERRGPWGRREDRGGGFLAGAAQTALGVTGGLLLGSAIAGMFGGTANAAEDTPAEAPPEETGSDEGIDAGGEDWGDGGGFDIGGEF
jgi:hypothetical protein